MNIRDIANAIVYGMIEGEESFTEAYEWLQEISEEDITLADAKLDEVKQVVATEIIKWIDEGNHDDIPELFEAFVKDSAMPESFYNKMLEMHTTYLENIR